MTLRYSYCKAAILVLALSSVAFFLADWGWGG